MCQPRWWGEREQMHALLRPAGDQMHDTRAWRGPAVVGGDGIDRRYPLSQRNTTQAVEDFCFCALFGRDRRVGECLLLREERKLGLRGPISVFDPTRTFALRFRNARFEPGSGDAALPRRILKAQRHRSIVEAFVNPLQRGCDEPTAGADHVESYRRGDRGSPGIL
jgi:hypothetical protein